MTIRTSSKTVSFARPFLLKGVDRVLAAGQYKVVTDEELIEELSFPVYRRIATMILVPADSQNSSSVEMVAIDPRDLQDAQDRDAEAPSSTTKESIFLK
ncbi:MAG: hypothetical protein WAV38_10565 [Xanthobacteraceae bacterium]|jgi:hypothetical protein